MGATGESIRRLTDFGANPAWYPDGSALVIGTEQIFDPYGRSQVSELWRVDVATGERTKIDTNGVDAAQPRVSPNGLRIAFWGLPEGTGKRVLYTVPVAGGAPLALTDDGYLNWNPVWSGDGRWLYFASDRGGWMNIWRVPIDETSGKPGGPPRQVTVSTQRVGMFDVPPGTDDLVLAVNTQTDRIERVPFDIVGRRTVGEIETIFEGSRVISAVAGSPDGRWIVFVGTDPQEDLFVVAADGTGVRRLTHDLHRDRSPTWTGDSERIVFFSDRPSGRYEIWSINRDGSGLQQLTATDGENPYEPRISPDGKRMVVHVFPGVAAMADLTGELPVHDFEPLPATESGATMFCTSYSPDGTRLVGIERKADGTALPGLIVFTFADGSYQRVTETTSSHDWMPDSRSLLVSQSDGVFEVDTVTGARRPVEGVEPSAWFVSGDGNYLITPNRRTEGDIWLLESVGR
jgi:Tol biopolymer transport system component